MVLASTKWIADTKFEGHASHALTVDGSSKTGNSPMELVLIGLCGCTAADVVTILQKKREPFTTVEVHAEAEKAAAEPAAPETTSLTATDDAAAAAAETSDAPTGEANADATVDADATEDTESTE